MKRQSNGIANSMAATNFSQPGAESKIQDGGAHKKKMAMLENSPPA